MDIINCVKKFNDITKDVLERSISKYNEKTGANYRLESLKFSKDHWNVLDGKIISDTLGDLTYPELEELEKIIYDEIFDGFLNLQIEIMNDGFIAVATYSFPSKFDDENIEKSLCEIWRI